MSHRLSTPEKKIIFLSSLGGALEFYDFIIYALFAPIIGKLFFPATNLLAQLLSVYVVFAMGYLIRPLGGIIFSHFGDKYGRKKTFISSVMLMAIPTCVIGLLPTYEQIGIFASGLLIFLRLLQGLSIGGELPGALTFTCEHVHPKFRGLVCSIIFACLNIGVLCGSFMNFILTNQLSNQALLSYGWRIPFIFGGLLGIVSYYIRKKMTESPLFTAFQQNGLPSRIPFFTAITYHWRNILQGVGVTILSAVGMYLLFIYMPTYLSQILFYPAKQANLFNTLNLILYTGLILIMGWYSDKIEKVYFLKLSALGFLLFSCLLFLGLSQKSFFYLLISLFSFSFLSAGAMVYPAILVELFPVSIRYTGIAISYNITFALFGGPSPFIATYLIKTTNNVLTPSFYLMLCALTCFITAFTIKSKSNIRLYSPGGGN